MNEILKDFIKVCQLANIDLNIEDIEMQKLKAGQSHIPSPLPKEHMAVYVFMDSNEDKCYKVGKVGANSNARYQSQHYNPDSSKSNLAKSILNDYDLNHDVALQNDVANWIKQNTTRINLLIKENKNIFILNLLEAFIQNRLQPKYEGHKSQRK